MNKKRISLFVALTFLMGGNMQASFMKGSNKHEVVATTEVIQASPTIADQIYHIHESLLVVEKKIKQAQEGQLTPQEKAALSLWTVKYANKTLLHVGKKTQAECDQDVKRVTNEMVCPCLPYLCCYQPTDQRVKKEIEDYLEELHQS